MGIIIIPFWMKDRLEDVEIGKKRSFCPTCDREVDFSIVKVRRARTLYSLLTVSTRDLGEFLVCPYCGGRFPYMPSSEAT